MAILLIAEHDNAASDQTAKALTAATQIGGDVHMCWLPARNAEGAADAKPPS
jgi:electron transfer flavoprotein alpha subunit